MVQRGRRIVAGLFVGVSTIAACQYSPSGSETDGPPAPDGAIDTPPPDECTAITARCLDDNTLRACLAASGSSTDTPCTWGCVGTEPTARCGAITPRGGGATKDDLTASFAGLADFTLAGTLDGDDGMINNMPPDGVDYHVANGIAVFRFKKLTISTEMGAIQLLGSKPIVLVADETITVSDRILATCTVAGTTPGPGGRPGSGTNNASAGGSGGGGGGDGGAGGGHGGAGGKGANNSTAGTAFGEASIPLLFGGGGGGAGDGGGNFGRGGGGGGGIQLVSNTAIVIEAGGLITAGGCGGTAGTGGSDSGGGGGAGGTILLEAPTITMAGTLAVNGGGGGGGGGGAATSGAIGSIDRNRTTGGGAGAGGGAGGGGGAGSNLDGLQPQTTNNGGGGGGGVGRIRINTRSGVFAPTGIMSPNFEDTGTTATQGTAAID